MKRPKPTTKATQIPVSQLLKKVPPSVRPTVTAARRMVRALAPVAEEIICMGQPPRSPRYMWKLLLYAVDGTTVLGIGTFPRHSTVYFYRGRELDDGSGLLQGSGKESRFITLHSPADAGLPALKRLVREAFKLGRAGGRRASSRDLQG